MKMKMTNAEAMDRLLILIRTADKGTVGYKIARNRRKISDEIKEYNGMRDAALKKYGKPSRTKPGRFDLTPEASEKLNAELADYSGIEVEIDILTVTPEELCKSGLNSEQMYLIDWMTEE